MDSDENIEHLALTAKALAHPARIRILQALMRRTRCMGCDFSDETGLAVSTTSEHLRILKNAGLIEGQVEHPYVCYTLVPAAAKPLRRFLERVSTSTAPGLPEIRSSA